MSNKNIINIKNSKGEIIECEVLMTINYEKTGKDYIIFTDHSMDEYGNVLTYANIYDANGNDFNLLPVDSEDEWNMLQTLLSSCQKTLLKSKIGSETDEKN